MQFVKNGPDVPDRLLQAHEDGRVVFFCGAGISMPAGLPGFEQLARDIFAELGEELTEAEAAAFNAGRFDSALTMLENQRGGGRQAVRRELHAILSKADRQPGARKTHAAILSLARVPTGCRLVTTNFDRLFEMATRLKSCRFAANLPRYSAPLLPVPKKHLNGIVYLHGLMPERADSATDADQMEKLVLTSADFGQAYLNERWAARFVTELFRNYIVCFVGYSIDDPVMRYITDAIAADRANGLGVPPTFAFGGYSAGDPVAQKANWQAKSVEPILYRIVGANDHRDLHETLHVWSEYHRKGSLGKVQTVLKDGGSHPDHSTAENDFVSRVLWAVRDQGGKPAEAFAALEPLPPLAWLEHFDLRRYGREDLPAFRLNSDSSCDDKFHFGLSARPAPIALAAHMNLIAGDYAITRWDRAMHGIGRWLCRHFEDDELLHRVSEEARPLHPEFVDLMLREIYSRSGAKELSASDQRRLRLWHYALTRYRVQWHESEMWLSSFRHFGLSTTLQLQLRALLAPGVWTRRPWHGVDGQSLRADVETAMREPQQFCIQLRRSPQWRAAADQLVAILSDVLHQHAVTELDLGSITRDSDFSYIERPSISAHPQNGSQSGWASILDLLRDSWLELSHSSPDRARVAAERWLEMGFPIFRRLALFAAAQDGPVCTTTALNWLGADDGNWIWRSATKREAFQVLRRLAPRVRGEERLRLLGMILKGPKQDDNQGKARAIGLRLRVLRDSGVRLTPQATKALDDVVQLRPELGGPWNEQWEFSSWTETGSGQPPQRVLPDAAPARRKALLGRGEYPQYRESWIDTCRSKPVDTIEFLLALAPSKSRHRAVWVDAMYAWSDAIKNFRSKRRGDDALRRSFVALAENAESSSAAEYLSLAGALAHWLLAAARAGLIAEKWVGLHFDRITTIHTRFPVSVADTDPVGTAINNPVGDITAALLYSWRRLGPVTDGGLPPRFRTRFEELVRDAALTCQPGRTMLCAHVVALHQCDAEWAREVLIPLFDWRRDGQTALAAWTAYLWSPVYYRPILDDLAGYLLDTAAHYQELGHFVRPYVSLFIRVALDTTRPLVERRQLRAAIGVLPLEGQRETIFQLASLLQAADDKPSFWYDQLRPFLKGVWPRATGAVPSEIVSALVRLTLTGADLAGTVWSEVSMLVGSTKFSVSEFHRSFAQLAPNSYSQVDAEVLLAVVSAVVSAELAPYGQLLERLLIEIEKKSTRLAATPEFNRLRSMV